MSDEELGTEEVTEAPGVDEVLAAEPGVAADEPAPPAPPAPPVMVSSAGEPPRRQTGLIVVVGAIALLLVVAVFAGPAMFDAVNKMISGKSTTSAASTPAKAKVTATIEFIEAILDGNTMAIRPLLTDEAQAAGTDAQWTKMASQDSTGNVKFAAPIWSGDTTAVVTYTAPNVAGGADTTGTLTFGISAADPLQVAMLADTAGKQDTITITVAAAGTGWRIVSLTSGTQTQNYDAAFIKSIVPTDTAQ